MEEITFKWEGQHDRLWVRSYEGASKSKEFSQNRKRGEKQGAGPRSKEQTSGENTRYTEINMARLDQVIDCTSQSFSETKRNRRENEK